MLLRDYWQSANWRKDSSNKKVFSWCWNDRGVDGVVKRHFLVATGKARPQMVESLTGGTSRRLMLAQPSARQKHEWVVPSRLCLLNFYYFRLRLDAFAQVCALWAQSSLPPTKEEVYVFARVCLSVCLSVCEQDYSKRREWISMKCCVSTDVGTWTNWLTFEPDPDYTPDARFALSDIVCATTGNFITSEKSHL